MSNSIKIYSSEVHNIMQAVRAYVQREHISNKSIHMYYNQQEHLQ